MNVLVTRRRGGEPGDAAGTARRLLHSPDMCLISLIASRRPMARITGCLGRGAQSGEGWPSCLRRRQVPCRHVSGLYLCSG